MFGLKDVFTTLNVLSGFAVIVLAMAGEVRWAAACVFAGYVFDALDGVVARLMKSGNKFGAEYDNVADLVTYSIAPSFVVFAAYRGLVGDGWAALLGACPVVAGALRFARFNVRRIEFPGYWVGLPRPASAVLLVSFCAARLFELRVFEVQAVAWAGVAFVPLVCSMNLMLMPFHGHHRRGASRLFVWLVSSWVGTTALATVFGFVWEACLFWSAAYTFTQGFLMSKADRAHFNAFVTEWRRGDNLEPAQPANALDTVKPVNIPCGANKLSSVKS